MSYLTSWRKLRSKNSAVNLSAMAGGKGAGNEVPKDSLTMPTLPMTGLPNIRFAKREVTSIVFEGPNSGYMGSLARLFDAVQILGEFSVYDTLLRPNVSLRSLMILSECIYVLTVSKQIKSPAKSKTQASSTRHPHTSG